MNILKKIKRELVVFLSKICLKSARNDYFGLDLKYPILYGMGRGYVIPREEWMGQCLKAFIETKPGCVIDVGVNVGVYLVKLRVLTDDIDYYGFEPNAVCNFYTNELIRLNQFKRARVLPLALSNEMNVRTLYANRLGDKGASLVYDTRIPVNLEYSSDVVTVKGDEFIELLGIKDVCVIKVDVEGAELFVLNGLLNTIEKYRPYFYIEVWASYSNGDDVNANERISNIHELITSRNYTILGVSSDLRIQVKKSPDELFDQYDPNYMFIPNERLQDFRDIINSMESCDVQVW